MVGFFANAHSGFELHGKDPTVAAQEVPETRANRRAYFLMLLSPFTPLFLDAVEDASWVSFTDLDASPNFPVLASAGMEYKKDIPTVSTDSYLSDSALCV
jgi:hypothetical protein